MDKMQAVIFHQHGNVDCLKQTYVPIPKPGPKEVLVKVKACALNHLDLWTLMGMPGIQIPLPHILGCDIAGEVVEAGARTHNVPKHKPVIVAPGIRCGKCYFCKLGWDSLCEHYRIMGLQVQGGFAEYVKVPAENIIPVSYSWSYEQWASVPLVYLTAWHMLVTRAGLRRGEKILVHAAGSGIGSAAIQIAKWIGAFIIATVGSHEKMSLAHDLGAHAVINYREKDFPAEIKKITDGHGVDVVVEHIGPETFPKSLACLSKKGRLVTCGVTSGPTVQLDLRFLFTRQLSITGCYMGGLKELKKIIALVKKKKLAPVVDKVFPLREAPEALRRMQNRAHFGKIVLTP